MGLDQAAQKSFELCRLLQLDVLSIVLEDLVEQTEGITLLHLDALDVFVLLPGHFTPIVQVILNVCIFIEEVQIKFFNLVIDTAEVHLVQKLFSTIKVCSWFE